MSTNLFQTKVLGLKLTVEELKGFKARFDLDVKEEVEQGFCLGILVNPLTMIVMKNWRVVTR